MKLNKENLKAVLGFADKNNVRFFLNGVYVDFDHKTMVATDGRAICVLRDVELKGEGSAIIPHAQVLQAVRSLKKGQEITIEGNVLDHRHGEIGNISYLGIDGKYPKYETVLRKRGEAKRGQMPHIRAALLEKAEDLMDALDYDFKWIPSRDKLKSLSIESVEETEDGLPLCEIVLMPCSVDFLIEPYSEADLDRYDRWSQYEDVIEEAIKAHVMKLQGEATDKKLAEQGVA